MPETDALPLLFRPPPVLRGLAAVWGIVCGSAALWLLGRSLSQQDARALLAALPLLLPCLFATAVWRRRVRVEETGVVSTTFGRTIHVAWSEIRAVNQTRTSFVIETAQGAVSAGWIARADRDRMMRLVIERARLTRAAELRWGLTAQYIPRTQAITFQTHAQRRAATAPTNGTKAGKDHDRDH